MYKYFATNEITGQKMYCSSDGRIHYELDVCPHCGKHDTFTHSDKVLICEDCYSRRASYYSTKSSISENSRQTTLLRYKALIQHYIRLKLQGVTYMLPRDLEEQLERVDSLLGRQRAPKQTTYGVQLDTEYRCKDCGQQVTTGVPFGNKVRCVDCASRYHRYTALCRRITVLTQAEVDELHGILDMYKEFMYKGGWSPNIPKVRKQLRDLYG